MSVLTLIAELVSVLTLIAELVSWIDTGLRSPYGVGHLLKVDCFREHFLGNKNK